MPRHKGKRTHCPPCKETAPYIHLTADHGEKPSSGESGKGKFKAATKNPENSREERKVVSPVIKRQVDSLAKLIILRFQRSPKKRGEEKKEQKRGRFKKQRVLQREEKRGLPEFCEGKPPIVGRRKSKAHLNLHLTRGLTQALPGGLRH